MSRETIMDFDYSVSTEDRFAIRKFIALYIDTINQKHSDEVGELLSDGVIAEGFLEFPLQKKELVELFYKKFFGRRNNYIALPKLKLTFYNGLFALEGTYEEFLEGILSTEGDIKLSLKKDSDTGFMLTAIKLSPRMRIVE